MWADGGYTGPLIDRARGVLGLVVEIVQRPQVPYFTVLPRRWVVEEALAWITGHRCCVRDYDACLTTTRPWRLVHDPHHQSPTHLTPVARKQLLKLAVEPADEDVAVWLRQLLGYVLFDRFDTFRLDAIAV
ncbi:hypothetical protein KCV87_12270 [Actinosynnema pretiosum subsp. pretiosum]|uniref:Mobile element protein n=1 Tax=Actinosynnema pretiosum subsp. pretiosum TaxID=103721 RepID=A0AA45LF59_9PSEU|nr:hypothetical protein KCV87_12270 [Actinosynnema pretiosum subsp. pretiosum]